MLIYVYTYRHTFIYTYRQSETLTCFMRACMHTDTSTHVPSRVAELGVRYVYTFFTNICIYVRIYTYHKSVHTYIFLCG